jgi:redox-sensitive bicupin YhaK (pirin superfamily)
MRTKGARMPMLSSTADTFLPSLTVAPWSEARTPAAEPTRAGPPAPARPASLSVQFSRAIAARTFTPSRGFSVRNVDLHAFRELASPIAGFDEFRVSAPVCGPHPHAGFSTVNYLFEDSHGNLRSRDSLGNDFETRPGGLVWTQTGSGLVHEELPAEPGREVHGLQLNINLGSKHKLISPAVLRLEPELVPRWRNDAGDRVRVVVGSFAGLTSPLTPVEPFSLFDIRLQSAVMFGLPQAHNALVYVLSGVAQVIANGHARRLESSQAVAFQGIREPALVQLVGSAHVLVLSGAEIREPMVSDGPFIMNHPWQIDAAFARYHSGAMGELDSLPQAYRGSR